MLNVIITIKFILFKTRKIKHNDTYLNCKQDIIYAQNIYTF